jgi:hypothetical protein
MGIWKQAAPLALAGVMACAGDVAAAAPPALAAADQAAAFKAAGFTKKGAKWVRCDDTETASAQPGWLEPADLNGDGTPEVWVKESSLFCYGNTAEAFVLLTKTPAGWKVLLDQVGVPVELPAKAAGWPLIEVGGPGMGPFPRYRYTGARYAPTR